MTKRSLIWSFVVYVVFCLLLAIVAVVYGQDVPVNFQWNASTGAVQGYKLYQGTTSGAYQSDKTTTLVGTGTTGSMNMNTDFSRYVAATAYDSSNRESAFSNEILCHPIVTSCEPGGMVKPGGSFFVQDGRSVTFTFTPGAGSMINNVTVDNVSQGPLQALVLSSVSKRTTVNVDLEPLPKVASYDIVTVTPAQATDPIVVELPDFGSTEYELRLYSFERQTYQALGTSGLLTRIVTLNKSGHYLAEYRGCTGVGTSRSCSVWLSSTDSANGPRTRKEDGTLVTRGWWMYQYTRQPGAPVIR